MGKPFILSLFLVYLTLHTVLCHAPGAEYTYLSMFVQPTKQNIPQPDPSIQQIHKQFSLQNPSQPSLRTLRRLRSLLENHKMEEDSRDDAITDNDSVKTDDQDDSDDLLLQEIQKQDQPSLPAQTVRLFGRKRKQKKKKKFVTNKHNSQDDESFQSNNEQEENDYDDKSFNRDDYMEIADENGERIDRISEMVKKLIIQFKIQSMVDVPCRAHNHWIPNILKDIIKKKKSFKYYCVDSERTVLDQLKSSFDDSIDVKFVVKKFWKEKLPKSDLVLSWAGLDNMKPENVNKYLHRLGNSGKRHKIILLGNHAGSLEKDGTSEQIAQFTSGGIPINLRRSPFNLRRPMRIINELSKYGNDKQLYVYSPADMYWKNNGSDKR